MTQELANDIYEYRNAIVHPQQCLLTCFIPPSRVGAVIGRKGNTILHIQKEASKQGWGGQVRLSVVSGSNTGHEKDSQGIQGNITIKEEGHEFLNQNNVEVENPTNSWAPVIIRGDPCGVFAAAKLLVPLLRDGASGTVDDGVETAFDMDDVVLDIPVHRSKHSMIIGKRGLTIATLSAEHNVRIMVPHRTAMKSSTVNVNVIQLEGELYNVEKCLGQILKLICSPSAPFRTNNVIATGTRSAADVTASSEMQESSDEKCKVPAEKSIIIKDTTKKDTKFSENTIIVPPELFSLVPSLGRIRNIGKSTNTVIRRKKMQDGTLALEEMDEKDESSGDEDHGEKNESSTKCNDDAQCTIHLIISGKSKAVNNATSQFQMIFSPAGSDSDDERRGTLVSVGSENEKHEKTAYPRKSKVKGRYGRGGPGRGKTVKK